MWQVHSPLTGDARDDGGMSSRFAVSLLLAAMIAGACGSSETSDEAATSSPTTVVDEPGDDATTTSEEVSGATNGAAGGETDQVPAASNTTAPTTTVDLGPPRSFRLLASGEILPHSPLWRGAAANAGGAGGYDFTPMFADVAERIRSADLAICHLETPIAPAGEDLSTDPLYGVPAEIADAIAVAGFDRCSTASNHVLDRYPRGIDRTVDVLEAAGVAQSGMARSPEEIEPRPFIVNDVSVVHLSYTYGTNGIPIPADQPWRTRLLSAEQVIADAQVARDLGAEVVVVSLHWGTEKQSEPNDEQLLVADQITATGLVDLVVGHHAHVIQPIALVNGVWVAYGLGDLLSNHPVADHWPAASQDGAMVEFEVTVLGDGTVRVGRPVVIPTWKDKGSGWIVRDVLADLGRPDLPDWRRAELEISLARVDEVLGLFVGDES